MIARSTTACAAFVGVALAQATFLTTPAVAGEVEKKPAPPPRPVTASLVADTQEITPGEPFHLGVRLRLDPGWHVYWKYPGDAGLSTEIDLTLPDGFHAGELQWPLPERFGQPGDIAGFGYADSVMFLAEVTPPDDLAPGGKATLRATADWLSCQAFCVPGRAELSLEIPLAAKHGRASAASQDGFAYWLDRVPDPDTRPDRPFARTTSGEIGPDGSGRFEIALAWKVGPRAVEWFPAPGEDLLVDDVSTTHEGRHTLIAFRVRVLAGAEDRDTPSGLESLIVYSDTGGRRHGVTTMVPIPPVQETTERSTVDG